ncbi:MAG: PIN domain-containing protein [Candidatus Margulisbacteria bacterium]|nr:PIN domain-containing protein [Candidatus Margulisiibacteriota bacterium]
MSRKLFLDSMVFIYHLEEAPKYINTTLKLFHSIEKGEYQGITSAITLAEILVKPYQRGQYEVVQDYRTILENFPNLSICAISPAIADTAAALSAKYALRLPDALQISCALENSADMFITNDRKLKIVKEIKIELLNQR